ncbi:hypothetical protein [Nevskia sp.]|uniref:hypothetical protein n=1 Tax=Nevskia sp. TaxID=1929292 RepID=UPI0025EF8A4A|nr:hypothetical protein [Nevskia sp.]
MRKLAVISGAALLLAGTWTAVAGPNNGISTEPSANAYLSLDFGHPNPARATFAPFHYGLRMSYDNRLRTANGNVLPPLAQLDFDARGNRVGTVGGVPFMARVRPPLKQNDGEGGGGPTSGAGSGGIEFFDLALLGVGVAGLGYLIYEVTANDESPDPVDEGGTTGGGLLGGGLLGGLLGGGTTGTTGTTGGLLGGLLGGGTTGGFAGAAGAIPSERDLERQRWLDGGTGHMGDLGDPNP